ncbi:hypothetical protein IFM89_029954 [Coptis chinensis]|uniref:Uncharacterized protein n=1 Tax=Coptis chinensis TaxID=261450 RepID=A0A835LPC4_9MAGN|nr:hypothetical protein IFM89_029954 [Coptis chinensis]
MGRGVSSGGGQSSLGYLFGSGEALPPKPQLHFLKVRHQYLYLQNLLFPRSLLRHLWIMLSKFQQAFKGAKQIIISELMARTLAILSRADLQQRYMLLLVGDLPLVTSLEMVVVNEPNKSVGVEPVYYPDFIDKSVSSYNVIYDPIAVKLVCRDLLD